MNNVTELSKEDQARFVELLLNPPPPNDALKRAFKTRYTMTSEKESYEHI